MESDRDAAPPVAGEATAVAAFVGWAPQGPTDRATLVLSWGHCVRAYGGLHAQSALGYAVAQFFANGGQHAWIVGLGGNAPLLPGTDAFWEALMPCPAEGAARGGVFCLDRVDLVTLLCVPGLTNRTQLGELALFCRDRRAFLIADAQGGEDPMMAQPIPGEGAANAAVYTPWVLAPDPLHPGQVPALPASGAVAGVVARTDAQSGVLTAPAGSDATITGAEGVAQAVAATDADALAKRGVNTIRSLPGQGPAVWGARTCAAAEAGDWRYVPVRRTALFLETSLTRSLHWTSAWPNDEPLWTLIRQRVEVFLLGLFGQGAFAGRTPGEAFLVRCGRDTMTQSEIDSGIVHVTVGFAPLRPAEFVTITLHLAADPPASTPAANKGSDR